MAHDQRRGAGGGVPYIHINLLGIPSGYRCDKFRTSSKFAREPLNLQAD
jgi:hypothetical protein